jgi:hypothetical protein
MENGDAYCKIKRSELAQITLAVLTLLAATQWTTHMCLHDAI